MQLGMIGLGRMGANIVRRLMRDGHECVVYDVNAAAIAAARGARARSARARWRTSSPKLTTPRAAWVMVPAGVRRRHGRRARGAAERRRHRDRRRQQLLPRRHRPRRVARAAGHPLRRRRHERRRLRARARLLPDDRRRATEPSRTSTRSSATLAPGVDAGAAHARARRARRARPSTATCTAARHGAGHFVKMVHNGIEYGLMAAYAEGLNDPAQGERRQAEHAKPTPRRRRCAIPQYYQYDIDIAAVAEVWRRGSVVASWLLDLTAARAAEDPDARASSRAASPTRARAAGRCWPRSTRACRRTCSPPRSTSASARAARPTSPTSCCRRCASSSAATPSRSRRHDRRPARGACDQPGRLVLEGKASALLDDEGLRKAYLGH